MTANANLHAVAVPRFGLVETVKNYVSLTKPLIIIELLITTVPAMIVARGGWPSTWLVVATVVGGTLSAGGANAINCWYDRDIDALMKRTRGRPMVTGAIRPLYGLAFGISLGTAAFILLFAATTPAAALLSLAGLLFYVLIYTVWLKRRTPQNIVIGGAAGAFPPLVGWAAVTGDVSVAAVVMFAIIFLWTPPHFWALALRLKDDYSEAGVPMLPVAEGPAVTRKRILHYSVALVAVSFLLPFTSDVRWLYAGIAGASGGAFVWLAFRLWRRPEHISPLGLYKFSLLYLALLFVAMGLDVALPG